MRNLRSIAAAALVLFLIAPAVTFAARPAHEPRTVDRARPAIELPAVVRLVVEAIRVLAKLGPVATPGGEAAPDDPAPAGDDQPPPPSRYSAVVTPGG